MDDSPGEGPGQPRRSLPVVRWERGGNAKGAIAVLGLSPPKVIDFAPEAFGRFVCFALNGVRGDSERHAIQQCRPTRPFPARRLWRKRGPSRGSPTRPGAQRLWREHRNPAWCGAGPAGLPSWCGRGAVAVGVVTARRAGTRSWKPRTVSTRELDTPAQPGDRRESERSERPGEQDCRARAMAERARRTRRGGWSR